MLVDGGEMVVEQQQKQQQQPQQQQRADLGSEPSIPPGLDQGGRREGFHKAVFDRTATAVSKRDMSSTQALESKPSEMSEVRIATLCVH